jgi:hypothetical protein
MTKNQKFKHLILISILLLSSSLTYLSTNLNSNSRYIQLTDDEVEQIPYNDLKYQACSGNIFETISWSFQSVNGAKITVFITDYINHEKVLYNYTPFASYMLSNNKTTTDEGLFNIPHDGSWFVFFLNQDPNHEQATVHIKAILIKNPSLFVILPLTLFILTIILFTIFIIIFKHKKIEQNLIGFFIWYLAVALLYFALLFPFYQLLSL